MFEAEEDLNNNNFQESITKCKIAFGKGVHHLAIFVLVAFAVTYAEKYSALERLLAIRSTVALTV